MSYISQASTPPLYKSFVKESSGLNSISIKFFIALTGSLLLWVSAKVNVHLGAVPFTMQTFVLMMLGVLLGWRMALATVLLYVSEGLTGLPVFAGTPAKGIGLEYMLGSTGGYILGFVVATTIIGWMWEKGFGRNYFLGLLSLVVGMIALLTCGVVWLSVFIGFEKALQFGLYPFIATEAAKIVLVSILAPGIQKIATKFNQN